MLLATYHAAHTASAWWALIVPGLITAMAAPPCFARSRGWGDQPTPPEEG